jgi:hypothetical protein
MPHLVQFHDNGASRLGFGAVLLSRPLHPFHHSGRRYAKQLAYRIERQAVAVEQYAEMTHLLGFATLVRSNRLKAACHAFALGSPFHRTVPYRSAPTFETAFHFLLPLCMWREKTTRHLSLFG